MVETKEATEWPPIGIKWYYADEWVAIACADCREILPQLPGVDLVLTDFPYANNTDYGEYQDTIDNLRGLIKDVMPELFRLGKVVLVATGIGNMFEYPKPDWVLSWHWQHTNSGSSRWGFNNWQPVLAYGSDPYLAQGLGRRQDATADKYVPSSKLKHPCPKAEYVWSWFLMRGSVNAGDLILDPFLGSGTTAYCAKKLNRKCIGIEIEEKYCEIAAKRCSQSVMDLSNLL